ncbi:hypothetical protein [Streptomyces sp. NPDC096132]|uniref:hypothetical protein n=1 Tax=Streptomyces sp. NPDC096132 TaxID=3366075 RepID=UPI00380C6649
MDIERMKRIANGSDLTPAVYALRRTEYLGDLTRPRSGRIPRTSSLPYADSSARQHPLRRAQDQERRGTLDQGRKDVGSPRSDPEDLMTAHVWDIDVSPHVFPDACHTFSGSTVIRVTAGRSPQTEGVQ